MQKYEEYDQVVAAIARNLDSWEPDVKQASDFSAESLLEAQSHLESLRVRHNLF